jgi:hypothetical protein
VPAVGVVIGFKKIVSANYEGGALEVVDAAQAIRPEFDLKGVCRTIEPSKLAW